MTEYNDFIFIYIYSGKEIKPGFYIPEWRLEEIRDSGSESTDKIIIWGALTMAVKDCFCVDLKTLNPHKLPTGKLVMDNYHVSLSHSGNKYMVALSSKNIGVDIQKVSEGRAACLDPNLDKWSEKEKEALLAKDDGFMRFEYWVKKESLYKFLDPGFPFDVNNKDVDTFDNEALFSVGTCDKYYFGICSELINDGFQIVIHSKDKIRKIL